MNAITITTRRSTITTTGRKAAQHAARAWNKAQIAKKFGAPRGAKGAIRKMAEAIYDVRKAAGTDPLSRPVANRLNDRLLGIAEQQIAGRRLSVPAGWDEFGKTVLDRRDGLWLVSGSGWYEYSKRHGSRYQAAAYLCGRDEGQYWAVRVPSTCESVPAALDFITPRPIREAQAAGLPVVRQGDIYFRPMRIAADDFDALDGTRHEARARKDGGWTIVHPEHRPARLSAKYTWRAYRQQQVDGTSRRAGD